MFVEMGSHDNVSEYQPGAKMFQIKDGKLVEYASGIRNPVGIAFYPGTSDLFVAVNERDGLGDNLPPDYFTYVKPGGFYGYPWSYTGKIPIPTWAPSGPTWWPRRSRRTCCFRRTARRPGWSSIPATISRPTTRATPLSRCTAPGTPASRMATRWCASA